MITRSTTAKRSGVFPSNTSLKFDGAGYVQITGGPTDSLGGSGQPMSCAVWVKMDSTHNLLNQRFPVCQVTRHLIRIDSNGSVNMGVWGCNVNTSAKIQKGVWALLGFTFDGTTGFTYVNGVQDTQLTSTPSGSGSNSLFIGVRSGVGSSEFKGNISGLRYWNRPLSPDEWKQLYSGVIPRGVVAQYNLDEGVGSVAYDPISGVNGTIVGGLLYQTDTPSKIRKLVDGNLITNGDFEYAPPFTAATTSAGAYIDGTTTGASGCDLFGAWAFVTGSNASVQFDPSVKFSGNYSLKLSTSTIAGTIVVGQGRSITMPTGPRDLMVLEPNTSYTLTCMAKCDNAAANNIYADLRQYDMAGTIVATTSTTKIGGTTDWTKLTATVITGANTRRGRIFLRINSSGNVSDAWFDDMQLVKS